MNEVAAQAGLSRRVFERRFLDALGRPPGGYLRRLRLEKVKNLLTDTSLPVSEISDAAGFGSPEYMTYAFRAEFEITPLQFRRRSRL
jgi:transcriptional regulator GlxA family with amidase domain